MIKINPKPSSKSKTTANGSLTIGLNLNFDDNFPVDRKKWDKPQYTCHINGITGKTVLISLCTLVDSVIHQAAEWSDAKEYAMKAMFMKLYAPDKTPTRELAKKLLDYIKDM